MKKRKQTQAPRAASEREGRKDRARRAPGLHQPGDGLGKAFAENPERIAAVLRRKMPPAARALLADIPWEAVPPDFLGKRFRRRHADLVLRARMRGGKALYVVAEFKTHIDPEVLAQLFAYCDAVARRHRRLHPGEPEAAVLPAVIYSGEQEWDAIGVAATEEQIMAVLELGLLGYLLLNLRREDLEALCFEPEDTETHSEAYSVLRALFWDDSGTDEEMKRIIEGTEPGGALEGHVFDFLWPRMSEAQLDIWYYSRPHLKEKSMDRVQLNQAIGRADGQRTMLQEMLENIFGPLPDSALKRIDEASPEQLKSWALSVSDAAKGNGASVDDVLNGSAR